MRVIFEVHWTREHEGKPENQTNVELVKINKKPSTITRVSLKIKQM